MYNRFLKTFVEVVEKGSFSKASASLYLSTPAVMKQINQLEKELGLTLFKRTYGGVSLTKEGEKIYEESLYIIKYCDDVLDHIKHDTEYHVRIATTTLCPAFSFIDICKDILKDNLQFKIDMIYLDEKKTNNIFDGLGKDYDFVVTLLDKDIWLEELSFLKLKDEPIQLMMKPSHDLVNHEMIDIELLNHQSICLAKKGYSISCDIVRDYIKEHHLDMTVMDRKEYYDSSIFNKCMVSNTLYPVISVWNNINPLLQFKNVNWDLKIPFGLFYSKNTSKEIELFVKTIQEYIKY